MDKMALNDILLYQTNKSIHFEGIDNSRPARYLKAVYHRFRDHFENKNKPVFTARLIEYPILFQYLKRDSKEILDFGCAEDVLSLNLAIMGYKVTGLDFRQYPFEHKNLRFIKADILQWDPPLEQFDTIVSISTIEHIGLSVYGDPKCKDGDMIAIRKLWSALRKGGDLIVTVPAGKSCLQRDMRIYDRKAIENLFPKVDTLRFFYKPDRYSMWEETTDDVISELVYDDYNAFSPALGVAFIVATKM